MSVNIVKEIRKLAIPNILSNISIPLLGMVDAAVVGHLQDIQYLGAVALGTLIFNYVFWGFGFFRMGTTGITAQMFGADNREAIRQILRLGLLMAALTGLALIAIYPLVEWAAFALLEGSERVEALAMSYARIRIWSAPAVLMLYIINGWFLGMQNARIPLILTLVVNITNIALDFILVMGVGMTSDGVAIASATGQFTGLALGLYFIFNQQLSTGWWKGRWAEIDWSLMKRLVRINGDIFIRTLSLITAFSFFTAQSAVAGDVVLAANSILLQFWHILSYGVDGFAFAAESLVGRFYGAKDRLNVIRSIRWSFILAGGLAVVLTLVFWLAGSAMLHIFTSNTEVILIASAFIGWTIAAPLINTVCFIWDGVYAGLTQTTIMRNSMLVATFLIGIPLYFLFREALGWHALWLSLTGFMMARGFILTMYRDHLWPETH